MCIRVIPSGSSCNLPALASSGLQRLGGGAVRVPPAAGRPGACGLASRSTCEGLAEEERLRSGPFPLGEVSRGRGGAARGSSRGTPKRNGSEEAVLLQRPGGGGDEDCGGDSGGNRRCPRGAAAELAAARTAAEGPAGRGAEQLRHGWHCVSRSAGASPRREVRLSPERWVASAGKTPFPLLQAAEH